MHLTLNIIGHDDATDDDVEQDDHDDGHENVDVVVVVACARILVGDVLDFWGYSAVQAMVHEVNHQPDDDAEQEPAKDVARVMNAQVKACPAIKQRPGKQRKGYHLAPYQKGEEHSECHRVGGVG